MRVSRESLIKIASETVERFLRKDRSIMVAYLCGSLLGPDYQLGGAADIDLIFIHSNTPSVAREIVPLSEDIHLDIAHHSQEVYRHGKQLRVHPWLGPTLNTGLALHDPRHMLDFVQASVRGQFDREDFILERAQNQLDVARDIWNSYQSFGQKLKIDDPIRFVFSYIRAFGHAVNAVASLSGPPLTERRLLMEFSQRAEVLGRPGLYPGALGLLGWPHIRQGDFDAVIASWKEIYELVPEKSAPVRVHPHRKNYYLNSFEAMLEQQTPQAMLWPMLRTLVIILASQASSQEIIEKSWGFLNKLGFDPVALDERLEALDIYLDLIEETLEDWARLNGISPP